MSSVRRLRLRKEKQRARRNRILLVFTIVFALFCITAYAWGDEKKVTYEEVIVNQGDTLWSIANQYTPASKDVRKTVHAIKKTNDCRDNVLYPGDVLLIPVYN